MPEIANPMTTGGFLQPSTNTAMLFHSVSEPATSLCPTLCAHTELISMQGHWKWHNNVKAQSPVTLYEVIGQERVLYPIEQHRGEQWTLYGCLMMQRSIFWSYT